MSDKPKRRLWQFHLSTVITLTVAAGALLGLNVFLHKPSPSLCIDFDTNELPVFADDELSRGMPFISVVEYETPNFRYYIREENDHHDSPRGSKTFHEVVWCYRGLAANLFISVVLLASMTIGLESIIRRREARKP